MTFKEVFDKHYVEFFYQVLDATCDLGATVRVTAETMSFLRFKVDTGTVKDAEIVKLLNEVIKTIIITKTKEMSHHGLTPEDTAARTLPKHFINMTWLIVGDNSDINEG